jgi:hypothetical protein
MTCFAGGRARERCPFASFVSLNAKVPYFGFELHQYLEMEVSYLAC